MEIIAIIVVIVLILINMLWILSLTLINKRLEDDLQEERKNAIKEINKLRKKD